MTGLLREDTRLYLVTGVFSILVYVVAIAILLTFTSIELDRRDLVGLTIGFLAFMGIYFFSMAFYRGTEERESE